MDIWLFSGTHQTRPQKHILWIKVFTSYFCIHIPLTSHIISIWCLLYLWFTIWSNYCCFSVNYLYRPNCLWVVFFVIWHGFSVWLRVISVHWCQISDKIIVLWLSCRCIFRQQNMHQLYIFTRPRDMSEKIRTLLKWLSLNLCWLISVIAVFHILIPLSIFANFHQRPDESNFIWYPTSMFWDNPLVYMLVYMYNNNYFLVKSNV